MTKEQIRRNMKQQLNNLEKQERDTLNQSISYRLLQTPEYINCSKLFVFVSFGTEVNTHEIIHQAFKDGKMVYVPRVEGNHMNFYLILSLEGMIASKYGVPEPLPIEENRYHILGYNSLEDKTKDNTKGSTKDNIIDNTKDNTKDNNKDNIKDNTKDNTKDNNIDNIKDNIKDNTKDNIKDNIEDENNGLSNNYRDTTNITNPLRLMIVPGLAFDITGNRIGYGAGFFDKYLAGYESEYFYKIALSYDFQIVEQFASEEHDIKVDAIVTQTVRLQCI